MSKQHSFVICERQCYIYHNYTYHRWHPCMCEGRHMIPKGVWNPSGVEAFLPEVVGVMHTVWPLPPVWQKWGMWVHCWGNWEDVTWDRETSLQMWNSWNLPMFLLKNGSLTLMCMASLMVLVMLCTSLSKMENLPTLMWCPEVLLWFYTGEVVLRCSFSTSQRSSQTFLCIPPCNPLIQTCSWGLHPLFWVILSPSLGANRRLLMVVPPLKWNGIPTLPQS